jgi:hypothetical protein
MSFHDPNHTRYRYPRCTSLYTLFHFVRPSAALLCEYPLHSMNTTCSISRGALFLTGAWLELLFFSFTAAWCTSDRLAFFHNTITIVYIYRWRHCPGVLLLQLRLRVAYLVKRSRPWRIVSIFDMLRWSWWNVCHLAWRVYRYVSRHLPVQIQCYYFI